jgi:hypothetical protein
VKKRIKEGKKKSKMGEPWVPALRILVPQLAVGVGVALVLLVIIVVMLVLSW